MARTAFDPFKDRLSRDIRNELSERLPAALDDNSLTPVKQAAAPYLAQNIAPFYHAYINDRLARYAAALAIISQHSIGGTLERALVLWDLGLFFEVHELLEHAWRQAAGPEKEILQAMIRAAGVYIHLENGNRAGAAKMAAKAAETLARHRSAMPRSLPLDLLLVKLQRLDPVPPKLSDNLS